MLVAQPVTDPPITDLIIVTDKDHVPSKYTILRHAHDDSSYEADLWKDGFLKLYRSYRYICYSTSEECSSVSGLVVVDICLTGDKDKVPTGYEPILFTNDTKEKSLKKKLLCVKKALRNEAIEGVCQIIILTDIKRLPLDFHCIGDVDGLLVCKRFIPLFQQFSYIEAPQGQLSSLYPNVPYPFPESQYRFPPDTGFPVAPKKLSTYTTVSTIDGIPFEVSTKLLSFKKTVNSMERTLVSLDYLMSTLGYSFNLEKTIII